MQTFDKSSLLDRLCGDEELAREIVGIFLEDSPQQIASLKDALERNDAEGVRLYAHSLKGSSGNVAAQALHAVALQLEQAGRSGDLPKAAALLPELEQAFAHLREELIASGVVENVP